MPKAESPDSAPLVSVVVLNWNGHEDTVRCLESLRRLNYKRKQIIVVDNGSTNDSVERIRMWDETRNLTLLETKENLGYAGGNNVGIRCALELGSDFVLVLNNDTLVAPDLIDALVNAACSYAEDSIFGTLIFRADQPSILSFAGAHWDSTRLGFRYTGDGFRIEDAGKTKTLTDYVSGAALFFRSDVIRDIGLFDERFFLTYEDSDWCYRAKEAGYRCRMVSEAKVWHEVAASFHGEDSPLRVYFKTRNRLLWAEKHRGRFELILMIGDSLRRAIPSLSRRHYGEHARHKTLAWAVIEVWRDLTHQSGDLRRRAVRWGLRDYVLRRFGNCPPAIRALNEEWLRRRSRKDSKKQAATFNARPAR